MDLREGLPISHGPLGGPPDPFRSSWRASRLLPNLLKGLPTPPGPLGVPLDPSHTSRRAS